MKLLVTTQAVDINHPILGFMIGWITEFSKHFDEVHVICLQKGMYNLPSNVFVYSLGKESGENKLKYTLRFYRHFAHIFFRVHVDYVFFHMGAIYNILAAPFFLIRKIYGTKFYWWKAHGHINTIGKLALLFVDRVYTSTESGFSIDTKKRHVIGQAIDTTLFLSSINKPERKKEIIFVGRVMPIKHIEDFIDTALILLEQNPELRFSIIGPNGDGTYYKRQRAKVLALGLENAVSFVDSKTQSELVPVYQNAFVFLNTSLTHSMDKTVLEAGLCGCVPVTGNKAFVGLLNDDGLYVETPTPQNYAEVIQKLLTQEDTSGLQMKLQSEIIRQHSLNTFPQRIFNFQ